MKEKVANIIFKITLFAYTIPLLSAIYSAFFGFSFFTTYYGLEAFKDAFLITGFIMCIIPILPICLLYDILFLIYKKCKKENKKATKPMLIFALSILGIAGIILCFSFFSYDIKEGIEKRQAKEMMHRAEVEIPYCYAEVYCDGILGFENYKTNCLFVDYDTHEVGFLTAASLEEFHKYKLSKAPAAIKRELDTKYDQQASIPLPDGNGFIFTYCEKNVSNHGNTLALILEFKDGISYYKEYNENERKPFQLYTELSFSEYSTHREP